MTDARVLTGGVVIVWAMGVSMEDEMLVETGTAGDFIAVEVAATADGVPSITEVAIVGAPVTTGVAEAVEVVV